MARLEDHVDDFIQTLTKPKNWFINGDLTFLTRLEMNRTFAENPIEDEEQFGKYLVTLLPREAQDEEPYDKEHYGSYDTFVERTFRLLRELRGLPNDAFNIFHMLVFVAANVFPEDNDRVHYRYFICEK